MTATAELIPEGFYAGKVLKGVFEAPEKKHPRMTIQCELGERDKEGNYVEGENRRSVMVFLSMSDAAWPYSEEKLKRLGFNGDFENPEFANGGNIELNCRHETWKAEDGGDGKTRAKWDIAGGFKAEPAPANVSKQFGARWRATNGTAPTPPAGKPAAPPPAKTAPPPAASKGPPPPAAKESKKPYTKDDAWEAFAAREGADAEKWQNEIARRCQVAKKADETQFDDADWECIGSGIPF